MANTIFNILLVLSNYNFPFILIAFLVIQKSIKKGVLLTIIGFEFNFLGYQCLGESLLDSFGKGKFST